MLPYMCTAVQTILDKNTWDSTPAPPFNVGMLYILNILCLGQHWSGGRGILEDQRIYLSSNATFLQNCPIIFV